MSGRSQLNMGLRHTFRHTETFWFWDDGSCRQGFDTPLTNAPPCRKAALASSFGCMPANKDANRPPRSS